MSQRGAVRSERSALRATEIQHQAELGLVTKKVTSDLDLGRCGISKGDGRGHSGREMRLSVGREDTVVCSCPMSTVMSYKNLVP